MSTETIGSSVYCSIFLNWVKDASLKAVLISEILTSVFEFIVISVSDPLGIGTLIPHPPITVSSSGNIFVNAFAAPVVVGTID